MLIVDKVKIYYRGVSNMMNFLEEDMIVFMDREFNGDIAALVNRDDLYAKNGEFYLKYGSDLENID